jgi:large subunit ribosomal protein L9
MKILLLQDVPKTGRRFEVKEVSSGYARNFLIPKKLAEIATDKAIARVEKLKTKQKEENKIREDLLVKNLEDLANTTITMQEKANEKGHLFAGIHKEELIPVIKEQTRLDIDTEHILLEKPIKKLGEHKVEVKVRDKTITFKLTVEQKSEEK